jgi:hypothetical protein
LFLFDNYFRFGDHLLFADHFLFSNQGGRLPSVHFRHLHIHQPQIEILFLERGQSLEPVPGYHHTVSTLLQQPHHQPLVHRVVLRQ